MGHCHKKLDEGTGSLECSEVHYCEGHRAMGESEGVGGTLRADAFIVVVCDGVVAVPAVVAAVVAAAAAVAVVVKYFRAEFVSTDFQLDLI